VLRAEVKSHTELFSSRRNLFLPPRLWNGRCLEALLHEFLPNPDEGRRRIRGGIHSVSETPTELTVRVGCHLVYETDGPAPILLIVRPRSDKEQRILDERLTFTPPIKIEEFVDANGNISERSVLQPGSTAVHHDALVTVPSHPDDQGRPTSTLPVEDLPSEVLRYTLPSRYCDSDRLLLFAAQQFAQYNNGVDRVIAICNWVHFNIQYVTGSGRPDISAAEIVARGYGVCRDFAHVAIALCRAVNIPARYVTGHLPDIGCLDPGSPMDFHAYFEAFMGDKWCVFDARFNTPRIGRIKIAHGLDAVDVAFSTVHGQARLASFDVWAYQVDPAEVTLDQPVDISKRLDGTPEIRFSRALPVP
jgi:transglutaminase-like putative cysteine protease